MAEIVCPHCKHGARLALSIEQIDRPKMTLRVIRCADCNAPVGALDQHAPDAGIKSLATSVGDKLDSLIRHVEALRKEVESLKAQTAAAP